MREKYKNILVAVDGSEQSDKAVREAVKLQHVMKHRYLF